MSTTPGKVSRFTEVDLVVSGLGLGLDFRVDGYDGGTSISIAWQGDRNTYTPGNDGKGGYAENATRHAIATVSMLETSDSLDSFSAWLDSGLSAKLTYIDKAGRTVLSGTARVRQMPNVSKSAGLETLTVDIHMTNVTGKVGGLNNPS